MSGQHGAAPEQEDRHMTNQTLFAVLTDVTETRCTIASLHDSLAAAEAAAERLDTGICGMPAQALQVASTGSARIGERGYHDEDGCWS